MVSRYPWKYIYVYSMVYECSCTYIETIGMQLLVKYSSAQKNSALLQQRYNGWVYCCYVSLCNVCQMVLDHVIDVQNVGLKFCYRASLVNSIAGDEDQRPLQHGSVNPSRAASPVWLDNSAKLSAGSPGSNVLLVALNITEDTQKWALLLYQAGQATQDILDTLPDTGDDYATAMTKLDKYFSPKKMLITKFFSFNRLFSKLGKQLINLLLDWEN